MKPELDATFKRFDFMIFLACSSWVYCVTESFTPWEGAFDVFFSLLMGIVNMMIGSIIALKADHRINHYIRENIKQPYRDRAILEDFIFTCMERNFDRKVRDKKRYYWEFKGRAQKYLTLTRYCRPAKWGQAPDIR